MCVLLPPTDTRELAYLHAIISAGAMHGIMDACSNGRLIQCMCDSSVKDPLLNTGQPVSTDGLHSPPGGRSSAVAPRPAPAPTLSSFKLSGCADHIGFAYRKSKEFVDVDRKKSGSDFQVQVDLHNYEAGRLVSTAGLCHLDLEVTSRSRWTFTTTRLVDG